ncbi:MBL fold metallo-hydrolase [Anaerosporobacter faecicola]|uniref:MBL fold metallo-hydrolase n=1 Tax=Anaerosporobacter faecicola TaxID=2718714 RepID=UPI00143B7892|nr:MBL fold metallo-hydrolase [Anaerosporobacter faecicola]
MLKFLGTGGAFNTKRGNTSAYFELGSELFLIDVGEDVFPKTIENHLFDQKTRVNIFITHLHSDHVGSLGTLLAYLYINVFGQDRSKICVYFPSEALKELLELQGVTEEVYTFYVNLWDELYVDGYQREVEYNFEAGKHTPYLDYKKNENCYHITFSQKKEFCFYYSGDTCEFNHQLSNPYAYDWIYHEVTMIKSAEVHFQYDKLLEATKDMPADQKKKFVLMHLDSNFDVERAKMDGFSIAGEQL